jgi:hypothetical protein
MAPLASDDRLLPPSARAELDRYPLTESEAAPHLDGPLGAAAGWYWCGAGGGPLALALHEETGLPLVALLEALDGARGDDLPLELVVGTGVGCDAHLLCGCGWHAVGDGEERLVGIGEDRVRALARDCDGVDPDDPPTAAAARETARFLVERVGRAPR